jgi:putative flippase GtrA
MALSRFTVAGAVNTGATYGIYVFLLSFLPYFWAYSVSYVVGLAFGYIINTYWVFNVKPEAKSAAMYPVVYVLNYFIGLSLLRVLVEYLDIQREIAPLIVVFATVPLMYLLMKFVFHGRFYEKTINQ